MFSDNPCCEIRILWWKLNTCFSTWKLACLLGILPPIYPTCDMLILSSKLTTCFLYLEIQAYLSRNSSNDFPTVIYLYYHGNWLYVSLLGNSHIFLESFHWFPYCDIRVLSWKLTTCYSTRKLACLPRILPTISLLWYAYIIIEIDYIFSNWK